MNAEAESIRQQREIDRIAASDQSPSETESYITIESTPMHVSAVRRAFLSPSALRGAAQPLMRAGVPSVFSGRD